jgi:hypothetical protein
MKTDTLKQFVHLRDALLKEKAQIEARLEEIVQALDLEGGGYPSSGQARGKRPARPKNAMSLREAVIHVTSQQPLTKQEILSAIQKLGYQFTARNPINSLNVVLYGKKPRFRNEEGRFSPLGNDSAFTRAKGENPEEGNPSLQENDASKPGRKRREKPLTAQRAKGSRAKSEE